MPIRIIVGGPPNSGKSTFTANLVKILQDLNVNAQPVELDLWSPTLDYLQCRITKEQRDRQKRKLVAGDDIKEACSRFKNVSERCDVAVGDAPGIISEETKQICKAATHGIIVCRDDKADQIIIWQNLFDDAEVEVIATVVSKIGGGDEIKSHVPLKVILTDLSRTSKETWVFKKFASSLKKRLEI